MTDISSAGMGGAPGTRSADVNASHAGFLRDLISVATRALRQIPREPEAVIPALIIPVFSSS